MTERGARAKHSQRSTPPLFEAFPGLRGALPWLSLGELPTPVERLPTLCPAELWIKRDDLSSPHYGGNKVRKLEFILADVRRRGCREVLTMGGLGTHHGLATAIHARRLGLDCTVVLSEQPVDDAVRDNLKLMHHYGARLLLGGDVTRTGLRFFVAERLRRPGAYFLYSGGSSPVGALGFVNAAFELRRQIEQGALPAPARVVCALGSNGTCAGLALGARLAGLGCEVIGVRVFPAYVGVFPATAAQAVLRLMRRTLGLLRRCDQRVPALSLRAPRVIDGYLGAGYGHRTAAGDAATQLLCERAGVLLEPTYTAKTFAALLDLAHAEQRADAGAGPLLYWHTFSSVDLSAVAASVDVDALPRALRRFITPGTSSER